MIPDGLVLAISRVADGSMAASHPDNRSRFLRSRGLDPERLATCEQVHGTRVQVVATPGVRPATDGLVTREPGLALLLLGADCPLVCLFDSAGPAIAVVHAGWRGLAAGILENAMNVLKPTDPGKLRAFMAPAAGPCCYEVGEEVAARFPEAAIHRAGPGSNPHLDLRRAAELALDLPVEPLGPACTICTETHFSYRRNATPGRHALVAGLR